MLRFIPAALFALIIGLLIGDELSQRYERMRMRSFCYSLQTSHLEQVDELMDFRIRHMCRINIP